MVSAFELGIICVLISQNEHLMHTDDNWISHISVCIKQTLSVSVDWRTPLRLCSVSPVARHQTVYKITMLKWFFTTLLTRQSSKRGSYRKPLRDRSGK